MKLNILYLLLCASLTIDYYSIFTFAEKINKFTIARVKYRGGDWYNGRDSIPNLLKELKKRTNIDCLDDHVVIELKDKELFNYPFIFITGHGDIRFDEEEVKALRTYLLNGGFLYVDDDYGLNKNFRREIKKVFPDKELVELPFSHPIYHCFYKFKRGLPKIHEHYEGRPIGYGIIHNGRLVLFYTYNTNISDGWEESHNDPPHIREQAFKMGINIVVYALTH